VYVQLDKHDEFIVRREDLVKQLRAELPAALLKRTAAKIESLNRTATLEQLLDEVIEEYLSAPEELRLSLEYITWN
jgi:hypothetical protein